MDIALTQEQLLIAGIALGVIALVLAVIGAVIAVRRRRRHGRLQERFGPEYDRAVERDGRRKAAEDLDGRLTDREGFRPTDPGEATREALRRRLAALQFRFTDEPADVMLETQRVAVDALRACGYPVAEERERALRLVSVDHPDAAGTLRSLLEGSYGSDEGRMRTLFVAAKHALRDVAGVTFGPDDLHEAPAGDDERAAAPPVAASAPKIADEPPAGGTQPVGTRPDPPAGAVPAPPAGDRAAPHRG